MKNETGRLNPYWILPNNQRTVHMFSNRALLSNIKATDKPIDVYLCGGATHCRTAGTLKNIGHVYLHANGLANILSYRKVKYRNNITYNDARDILNVYTPYKQINLRRIKIGMYYHNCETNGNNG